MHDIPAVQAGQPVHRQLWVMEVGLRAEQAALASAEVAEQHGRVSCLIIYKHTPSA